MLKLLDPPIIIKKKVNDVPMSDDLQEFNDTYGSIVQE